MRGYAQQELFSKEELDLRRRAERLVRPVPYRIDGKEVRCHELARAVGKALGLPVADGWYGMVEHSWLWTAEPTPFRLSNVLDVYAPGRVPQVVLVHMSPNLPFEYRRGDPRKDVRRDVLRKLETLMGISRRGGSRSRA